MLPTEQAAAPPPAVPAQQQPESPTSPKSVSTPPTEEEPVVASVPVLPEPSVPAPLDHAAIETALGLGRAERRLVQQGLVEAGQEPEPADGLFGGEQTRTRQAIRA